jgi:hypothetical protein
MKSAACRQAAALQLETLPVPRGFFAALRMTIQGERT